MLRPPSLPLPCGSSSSPAPSMFADGNRRVSEFLEIGSRPHGQPEGADPVCSFLIGLGEVPSSYLSSSKTHGLSAVEVSGIGLVPSASHSPKSDSRSTDHRLAEAREAGDTCGHVEGSAICFRWKGLRASHLNFG